MIFNKPKFASLSIVFIILLFISLFFSTYYFYTETIETEKKEIQEKVKLISSMIQSVAIFDNKYSKENDFDQDPTTATLSQIKHAFSIMDVSMEYLLASVKDEHIVFEAYSKKKPPSVKLSDKRLAVPMRKALDGLSGVIIELDYEGEKVFAAYTKIKGTDWGLVIKQPYVDFIEPIILKTLYVVFIFTVLLISLFSFIKSDSKHKKAIERSNKKLEKLNQSILENQAFIEYERAKYYQIVSMSSDAIFIMDIETGDLLEHNSRVYKLLQYEDDELDKLNVLDWDKDFNSIEEYKKISAQVGYKPIYIERTHTRKDGSTYDAGISAVRLNINNREVLYVSVRDMTEHNNEVKNRLAKEAQLQAITDASQDAIIQMDNKGNISFWNKAATTIFGYAKEEAIGKNLHQLLTPARYKDDFEKAYPKFLSDGTGNIIGKTVETEAIHKDGHEINISISVDSMYQDNEWHAVGIIKDITEKIVQEKIQVSQSRLALMGEMISMIAHQWRQPLAVINSVISSILIKNELSNKEDTQLNEQLNSIQDVVKHLSKTIDDFRYFYKNSSGVEKQNILEVITNTINIVSDLYRSNGGIKFVTDFDEQESIFLINSSELSQVLLALFSNAKDALMERAVEDPTISVSTKSDSKYKYIIVEDNAGGIPEEIIEKIFDPYFSTKGLNGTGIGLHMAYSIVTQHFKGNIEIVNTDKGAKLTISILKQM